MMPRWIRKIRAWWYERAMLRAHPIEHYADAMREAFPGETNAWYLDAAKGSVRGLAEMDAGLVVPWEKVKKELGL